MFVSGGMIDCVDVVFFNDPFNTLHVGDGTQNWNDLNTLICFFAIIEQFSVDLVKAVL